MFYLHPYLGKIPILTNIFQMGWNHQLVYFWWQNWLRLPGLMYVGATGLASKCEVLSLVACCCLFLGWNLGEGYFSPPRNRRHYQLSCLRRMDGWGGERCLVPWNSQDLLLYILYIYIYTYHLEIHVHVTIFGGSDGYTSFWKVFSHACLSNVRHGKPESSRILSGLGRVHPTAKCRNKHGRTWSWEGNWSL